MAALLTAGDLRKELDPENKMGADNDTLLGIMANAILSLWDYLTGRTWQEDSHIEYHNSDRGSSMIFLKNFPVSSSQDFTVYDDPDWEWGSDTLVPASDYRVDYTEGIVYYYGGCFSTGRQSLKVTYTAGYTSSTLDAIIRQIWVRQASVWFKQAKTQEWHVSSKGNPANAGSISYRFLEDNLLADFRMMAEFNKRNLSC